MSRNERRALEKAREKELERQSKLSALTARAQSLKAQGMALKATGNDTEAAQVLSEALAADSSMADVHFTLAIMERTKPHLGLRMENINRNIRDKKALTHAYQNILYVLKSKKQYKEALICQEELCRLEPDDAGAKINLAFLYNITSDKLSALRVLAELIRDYPEEPTYRGLFSNLCGIVSLTQFDPLLQNALQACFDDIYSCNLHKALPLWLKLVITDPQCADILSIEHSTDTALMDQCFERLKPAEPSFINNPFYLDGLRLLLISELAMENILKNMRRWLCLNLHRLHQDGRLPAFEDFLCALGEQLFYNEYIYSQSEAEIKVIDTLISDLRAGEALDISRLQAYALISCYHPLNEIFPDAEAELEALAQSSTSFARLVTTQFENPRTEEKLRPALRSFGRMQNDVSRKVQSQYEENPYPRWISMPTTPMHNDDIAFAEEHRYKEYRVLVAGCGTGRQALSSATHYPNAHITAIDLSRTSLAYGLRKAQETHLADRISFIHADILDMKEWDGQFDIIECSGVLHHMEDPFAGWKTLNDLLVPGGYFKVGLYSALARQQIVEARQYIAEKNYSPTPEGIRACRDEIIALPVHHPMRQHLIGSNDFFSMSLLRDLIFHVQEHRMTLPQIQEMMDKLGLTCLSVNMPTAAHLLGYEKTFPQDTLRNNLLNWHSYEIQHPDSFVSMYQFWSQKKS